MNIEFGLSIGNAKATSAPSVDQHSPVDLDRRPNTKALAAMPGPFFFTKQNMPGTMIALLAGSSAEFCRIVQHGQKRERLDGASRELLRAAPRKQNRVSVMM